MKIISFHLSSFGGGSAILELDNGNDVHCSVVLGKNGYYAKCSDPDTVLPREALHLLLKAHHEAQLGELDRIHSKGLGQ